MEITVENNDYDFKTFEGSGIHSVKDFTVGEVTEEKNGDQMYFSGSLTNDSDEDLGGVIATIVFKKDGNIVGGVTGQVGGIVAGDTTTFNIAAKSGFSDYDSYDVYVTQERRNTDFSSLAHMRGAFLLPVDENTTAVVRGG